MLAEMKPYICRRHLKMQEFSLIDADKELSEGEDKNLQIETSPHALCVVFARAFPQVEKVRNKLLSVQVCFITISWKKKSQPFCM